MSAPGSVAAQVALLFMLERYERGERLVTWFPALTFLGPEADRRHDALLKAAINCGFRMGHESLSILDWSQRRAALIRRVMPNHAHEAQRRAA